MNLLTTRFSTLADGDGPEAVFSWLLPAAATNADHVDWLFYFILGVSLFFFVLISALQLWYCYRYRRKSEHEAFGEGATHNTPLEITWSVLPLFIVLYMFYWGMVEAQALSETPKNAYNIDVSAQKWSWTFRYPGGLEHDELHLWQDQPVRLTMTSQDVLHSFYVPQFRTKMDIIPGRYSETWIQPRHPKGETKPYPLRYRLFCTEYCGQDHWNMKTYAVVHKTEAHFREWLTQAGVRPEGTSREEYGKEIWEGRGGCKSCHAVEKDAPRGTGPSWYDLSVMLRDGASRPVTGTPSSVLVDAEYVRESIVQPKAQITAEYPAGGMPVKRLSDDDIDCLIAYIRSLAPAQ